MIRKRTSTVRSQKMLVLSHFLLINMGAPLYKTLTSDDSIWSGILSIYTDIPGMQMCFLVPNIIAHICVRYPISKDLILTHIFLELLIRMIDTVSSVKKSSTISIFCSHYTKSISN